MLDGQACHWSYQVDKPPPSVFSVRSNKPCTADSRLEIQPWLYWFSYSQFLIGLTLEGMAVYVTHETECYLVLTLHVFQAFHEAGTGGSHNHRISAGSNTTLLWGWGKQQDKIVRPVETGLNTCLTHRCVLTCVSVSRVFGHDYSEGTYRQTSLKAVSVSPCAAGP